MLVYYNVFRYPTICLERTYSCMFTESNFIQLFNLTSRRSIACRPGEPHKYEL